MQILPMLSTSQLAQLLGVSRATLISWRRQGSGPRFVKVGRAVRYRQEDLKEWLESLEVKGE